MTPRRDVGGSSKRSPAASRSKGSGSGRELQSPEESVLRYFCFALRKTQKRRGTRINPQIPNIHALKKKKKNVRLVPGQLQLGSVWQSAQRSLPALMLKARVRGYSHGQGQSPGGAVGTGCRQAHGLASPSRAP